jgi:uncharacterized protein (UPF0335 family)
MRRNRVHPQCRGKVRDLQRLASQRVLRDTHADTLESKSDDARGSARGSLHAHMEHSHVRQRRGSQQLAAASLCRSAMDVRSEESLLTSLSELRAIEAQRIADERAACDAAERARREARQAEEQRARDAEAARLAAARDAELAAEHARAAAEREARLRIEAAEAAERARHQVALDQQRLVEELALRREVARRQRPRWMIALTATAVTAAIALGAVALHSRRASADAQQRSAATLERCDRAEQQSRALAAELEQLSRDLAGLGRDIAAAIDAARIAQGDADRRAAQERLLRGRRRQREIEDQRLQRARELERQERIRGVKLDDCLHDAVCREALRAEPSR